MDISLGSMAVSLGSMAVSLGSMAEGIKDGCSVEGGPSARSPHPHPKIHGYMDHRIEEKI